MDMLSKFVGALNPSQYMSLILHISPIYQMRIVYV